jgi:hypothetical protein
MMSRSEYIYIVRRGKVPFGYFTVKYEAIEAIREARVAIASVDVVLNRTDRKLRLD